jgi:fucose 4-O-acetylase-like acetyltransferase
MMATLRMWISKAFNSSIIEKDRHIWIDYLRGIAIILVVYHHTFLGIEKNGIDVPNSIVDANMAAYSFRMPLFFIFSGIFASLSLASKPLKNILWSKFSIILYPYLVWTFLQITLQIVFSGYTNSETTFSDYLYIFYQPKQIAHFWYLPALFNATIIFVLIKTQFKIKTTHHFLLGLIFFLIGPFFNSISMLSNWMRFYIFLVIGDALSGVILQKQVQFQLKKLVFFLASIPVFLAAQYYYFYYIGVRSLENDSATLPIAYAPYVFKEISFLLTSLAGCTTFILFAFLLEKWNRFKWLRIIGYHSLYIYIMHVIVVACNRIVLTRVFGVHNYLFILLLGITLGVVIPVVFYNLIGKKYLWFLFSAQKSSKKDRRFKQINLRPTEVRLSPLQSNVNNI